LCKLAKYPAIPLPYRIGVRGTGWGKNTSFLIIRSPTGLLGNGRPHGIPFDLARSMAKYSKSAGDKVEKTMQEMKEGKLKSGRSGKKVTNRKQAIAIGLSEARKKGAKVPKKK